MTLDYAAYTQMGGVMPAVILIIALVVKMLLTLIPGAKPYLPLAFLFFKDLAASAEKRLNRLYRSSGSRSFRGMVVTIVLVGLAIMIGGDIHRFRLTVEQGWLIELLAVALTIGVAEPWRMNRLVKKGTKTEITKSLQSVTGRNLEGADDHTRMRAAIEFSGQFLNRHVVGPGFWYVVLGLPGLMGYTALSAVDRAIGHRNERYKPFGWFAARMDDIFNLVPARLTAFLIVIAALFSATAKPVLAFNTMVAQAGKHKSLNAGWPLAAVAGALNLTLAGPVKGEAQQPWIGPENGRARVERSDIKRASLLYFISCIIFVGTLLGLLSVAQ